MKVTLVWAKNDKNDIFTNWINDRGNTSDCLIVQCLWGHRHHMTHFIKNKIILQQKYVL